MNKLRVTIALLLITLCATTAVAQFLNFNLSQDFRVKTYNTQLSHGNMTYEISVDFPISGPRPLIDSIRTHIFDRLFAYDSFSGDDDASMTYKVPPLGTDLTPLLEKAGKKFIQDNLKANSEMQESDPEYTISNSYQQKIKLIAVTSNYVSFKFDGYYYSGGAHGMPWEFGLSFNCSNGKVITWEDLFTPNGLKILNPMIDYYLRAQYFADEEEGDIEFWCKQSELVDYASFPVLTQKGLTVHFSAYAIGPYAIGMPTCTIPYNVIAEFMTPFGKKLTHQR